MAPGVGASLPLRLKPPPARSGQGAGPARAGSETVAAAPPRERCLPAAAPKDRSAGAGVGGQGEGRPEVRGLRGVLSGGPTWLEGGRRGYCLVYRRVACSKAKKPPRVQLFSPGPKIGAAPRSATGADAGAPFFQNW